MTVDRNAYIVREWRSVDPHKVTVTVVDLAGSVCHVTMPKQLSTSELADPLIRARLAARRDEHKPTG